MRRRPSPRSIAARAAGQRHLDVVQPLAMRLLQAEFHDGDTVVVDAENDALTFRRGAGVTSGM